MLEWPHVGQWSQLSPASFQSSSSKPLTCEGSYHGPSKPARLPTEYHRMALVKATWSRRSAQPSIVHISDPQNYEIGKNGGYFKLPGFGNGLLGRN